MVSKVLESLIYWSMIDFVRSCSSHQQFGFLENRSCVHKVLLLLHSVTNSIEIKYRTDVIFLDLRKVFDMVCHKELMLKLSMLGILGPFYPGYIVIFQIGFTRCVLMDASQVTYLLNMEYPREVLLVASYCWYT